MDNLEVLTILKILLLGESNVGKSSIVTRFVDDTFDENLKTTVGFDYKSTKITIDGKIVKLAIWDTAGCERFRTLTPNYYRDGQGVVFVYDVSDSTSLKKLNDWLHELEMYCSNMDVVKMLVANKIDLPQRQVTTEEGLNFARRHQMLYIESSAKTADGIHDCFEELVHKIIETPELWDSYTDEVIKGSNISNMARKRFSHKKIRLKDDCELDNEYSRCYCNLL